jgi:cobalt-precorrin 5A hydrolase
MEARLVIAAGIGCRAGCAAADIVRALELALTAAGLAVADVHALFSAEFKSSEGGLRSAASELELPVFFLSNAALASHAAACLTHSPQVARRTALPSVAEAAALAGAVTIASGSVRLLGVRQLAGGAACALAQAEQRA